MERLAERLAKLSGVVAVTLGGSRATGTHRPDSDWDLGLYYRGHIDPDEVRALGYPGEVSAPGDWAYPMNGGAWLTIDGQRVDLIYRDLDDVERWIAESEEGRWELFRVPGYLAGMASYFLLAELALARVLAGSLPQPSFPDRLRETARSRWAWERTFALVHARAHASRLDRAAAVGKACLAILADAHARLAAGGEWTVNEKGIVRRAGLDDAEALISRADEDDLPGTVRRLGEMLES